jgi:hypothetical protein
MSPEDVADFSSFLAFLDWLAADRLDELEKERTHPSHQMAEGANGWQNGSIEAFLDAAAAWARVSHRVGITPQPSWTYFARILLAGKEYE